MTIEPRHLLELRKLLERKIDAVAKMEGPPGKTLPPLPAAAPLPPADPLPPLPALIPKDGEDGEAGKDGISVVDAEIAADNHLILHLSNGNIIDAGEISMHNEEAIRERVSVNGTEELRNRLSELERISMLRLHGGVYVQAIDATTPIAVADTYYQAVGVVAAQDLNFGYTPSVTHIAVTHDHTEPGGISHTYDIDVSCNLQAGVGDEVYIQLRVWDSSESVYINITKGHSIMVNAPGGQKTGHVNLSGRYAVENGDRVELWVNNTSGTTDVVIEEDSSISVRGI